MRALLRGTGCNEAGYVAATWDRMMLQTVVLLEPLAAGSAPDRVAAGGHPQGRRGAWQTAGEQKAGS